MLALPLAPALSLLPEPCVTPELRRIAQALADEQAEGMGWVAGLRRLPRLRSSGERESHVG